MEALRAGLGPDVADVFCPLVAGGVNLHKLYGVMHDTCHTANLVASLIVDLQQRKKREFLGDDAWEQASPETRFKGYRNISNPVKYLVRVSLRPGDLSTDSSLYGRVRTWVQTVAACV